MCTGLSSAFLCSSTWALLQTISLRKNSRGQREAMRARGGECTCSQDARTCTRFHRTFSDGKEGSSGGTYGEERPLDEFDRLSSARERVSRGSHKREDTRRHLLPPLWWRCSHVRVKRKNNAPFRGETEAFCCCRCCSLCWDLERDRDRARDCCGWTLCRYDAGSHPMLAFGSDTPPSSPDAAASAETDYSQGKKKRKGKDKRKGDHESAPEPIRCPPPSGPLQRRPCPPPAPVPKERSVRKDGGRAKGKRKK